MSRFFSNCVYWTKFSCNVEVQVGTNFLFFLKDILYYEQLKTNVLQHDLLVDSLLYKVRNFCKFTIYLHYILKSCVFTDFICEPKV